MNKQISYALLCFVLIVGLIVGCKKDNNPITGNNYTDTGQSGGQVPVHTDTVTVVKNPYGSTVVSWGANDTLIHWTMNKTTKAPSQSEANKAQTYIKFTTQSSNDTMYIEIAVPPDKLNYDYICNLTLLFPAPMHYDSTATFKQAPFSD